MPNHNELVENLYQAFRVYAPGSAFNCTFCYSADELSYYKTVPIDQLSVEASRAALYETGDHWESSEAYRRFLPRMLEIMGPPYLEEDLYPKHIFETLNYHRFSTWPKTEREAVVAYLKGIRGILSFFDEVDENEWDEGMKSISDV
jgi:hypothetical protein